MRTSAAFLIACLVVPAVAAGEEGAAPRAASLSVPAVSPLPGPAAPALASPSAPAVACESSEWPPHHGPRGRGLVGFRSKFREELSALGEEITRTRSLIAGLEQEIEAVPAGDARLALRQRLDEARRHSAELQLTLAQKKADITRQGLEFAQKRYDDARLELEKAKRRIKRQYPELVGQQSSPPAP